MSRWQSMTIARDEGTDQCSLATAVALRAPSAAKEHLIAISPVNDVMALLGVNDVVALEIRSLPLAVLHYLAFFIHRINRRFTSPPSTSVLVNQILTPKS